MEILETQIDLAEKSMDNIRGYLWGQSNPV